MHDSVFAHQIKTVVNDKLKGLPTGTSIVAINVALSPLSHVKPETLKEAFAQIVKRSRLENIPLNITMGEIKVECRSCGKAFRVTDPIFSCPDCKSADLYLEYGPEFFVESIKIENESRPCMQERGEDTP